MNAVNTYFDACFHADKVLGFDAPRHFEKLRRLSRSGHDLASLRRIVEAWKSPDASGSPEQLNPIHPDSWTPGGKWGDCTRIRPFENGASWEVRCACGAVFVISDYRDNTVPVSRRKCATCLRADELDVEKQKLNLHFESIASQVLEWHRQWDALTWQKVYQALRGRGIPYEGKDERTGQPDLFAAELHALVWAKIGEKAAQYRDLGCKVQTWLGVVAENTIKDFFKKEANRTRLAPTESLFDEVGHIRSDADGGRGIVRPVRPRGASPHDGARNPKQRLWDKAQHWNR